MTKTRLSNYFISLKKCCEKTLYKNSSTSINKPCMHEVFFQPPIVMVLLVYNL